VGTRGPLHHVEATERWYSTNVSADAPLLLLLKSNQNIIGYQIKSKMSLAIKILFEGRVSDFFRLRVDLRPIVLLTDLHTVHQCVPVH